MARLVKFTKGLKRDKSSSSLYYRENPFILQDSDSEGDYEDPPLLGRRSSFGVAAVATPELRSARVENRSAGGHAAAGVDSLVQRMQKLGLGGCDREDELAKNSGRTRSLTPASSDDDETQSAFYTTTEVSRKAKGPVQVRRCRRHANRRGNGSR